MAEYGLHAVGRDQAASTLARGTHEMSQSVLGDEHPDTWSAAVTWLRQLSQRTRIEPLN
ncbi:hypothetical protein [Streptomyces sp. NPDC017435]|uniref:hypothetical protein n=1 Tax=Streptomyces sp. NPDC017435 TaxID=3364995 RepID=UPI0037AF8A33